MKHVYLAYRINEGWCETLGVYSTFELAKARLHRYMSHYGWEIDQSKWNKDDWSYRDQDDVFTIVKTELDPKD